MAKMSGQGDVVLVSGASGFVGAAVVAALRAAGNRVLALDIRGDEAAGVVGCDLLEAHRLHELAQGHDIRAILHCGGVSGPMLHQDRPAVVAQTNVEGTLNLLELARINRISRFVFCSSASVYGPRANDEFVREHSPLHPSSVYAATKIAGEALVEAYSSCHGLGSISLRIAAVYGPGRRTACLIRDMIAAGLEGRPLAIETGGNQRYHFVHVSDVVSALMAALGRVSVRGAFTISGDQGLTPGELAGLVRRIVPGPDIVVGSARDDLSDPQGPYDLSTALAELEWRPSVHLEDGIASYADWLRRDLERLGEAATRSAPPGGAEGSLWTVTRSDLSTGDVRGHAAQGRE